MYEMSFLRLMTDHARWMNRKLYEVCAGIPDEERRRDLGAFFPSIHGTLNHLLLVDRLWLGRITAKEFRVCSLDQELCADFDELRRERELTDGEIAGLVSGLEPSRLSEPVSYVSFLKRTEVSLPLGVVLTHFFHHQTHHRGQITTLISQLGYEFGDTDLIYMPGAQKDYF
jgi:uncharacterized damage-inducible protein DinB